MPLYLSRGRGGTSKAGRMQAFRHSTCHTTTHTERHREIPDCIYPFTHMHYVTFPTCILALHLQTVPGTRCNTARSSIHITYTLHTHYIIFADLRRTRRDTCAAPYTLHHICRPAKGLGVKPVSNEQLQYTKCTPWCNTWRACVVWREKMANGTSVSMISSTS